VERGVCKNGLLIAPTAADVRDTCIEGCSGLLSIAPPWNRPRWEPSKRRLTWPSGSRVTCIAGEEPERARGLNVDTIWADELPAWSYPRQTWDLALLALRAGPDPRAFISTTPRRTDVLIRILNEPTTAITRESTFANKLHLSPAFIEEIVSLYSGTRFASQEIEGRLVETAEGAWFSRFDPSVHVQRIAILHGVPAMVSIDAGTSRHTSAVFLQCQHLDAYRVRFLVHDCYLAVDKFSRENAEAIRQRFYELFPGVAPHVVYIDGASGQRTSIGPAAREEYEAVFGERKVVPVFTRSVTDALDQMAAALERGDLIIHPRATAMIESLKGYSRMKRGGEYLDLPALSQPGIEDPIDACRMAIQMILPPRKPQPDWPRVHASLLM
jgi:hypothetical protein